MTRCFNPELDFGMSNAMSHTCYFHNDNVSVGVPPRQSITEQGLQCMSVPANMAVCISHRGSMTELKEQWPVVHVVISANTYHLSSTRVATQSPARSTDKEWVVYFTVGVLARTEENAIE